MTTAREYFKNDPGFERFLIMCKNKYISLSRVGGCIKLNDASPCEKNAIGGLLGLVFEENNISVSLSKVDDALKHSKFKIGLPELLYDVFDGAVMTRAEEKLRSGEDRRLFFEDMMSVPRSVKASAWLAHMINNNLLNKRYNDNKDQLRKDIDTVCRAIDSLGEPELLPVFAASISGDPHTFDANTSAGQLLDSALAYISGMSQPKTAAQRANLLSRFSLYNDMISSFVYCKNIRLYEKAGVHPAYDEFIKRDEAFTLNIGNILHIVKAEAMRGIVFIVENPAVFTSLAKNTTGISLICTAGQPKSACIHLLDILGDCTMYYSGDFDLGGMRIAERLLDLFPSVKPWKYDLQDYDMARSDIKLSEASVKGLHKISSEKLKKTAEYIAETGYAGYQENILRELISDVLSRSCN